MGASAAIERADALRRQSKSGDLTPSLLLLGLVSDDGGVVNKALAKLGATPDGVREAVAKAR